MTNAMTFGETFRAIRGGDIGVIVAFTLEGAIMLSPIVLFFGAWLAER